MPIVNYAAREIACKIVYAGPARAGKTTNLHALHARIPEDRRGPLMSLATEDERTLFFDFLPLDLGTVAGYRTRFQLYTVPGQPYYRATRKLVLQGADAVVFVADAQRRQLPETLESFRDLHELLAEAGIDPRGFPMVLQYNKQDLPAALRATDAELDDLLNFRGLPRVPATALAGEGVLETLRLAAEAVLRRLGSPAGR